MAEVRPIILTGATYTRTAIAMHWLALLLIVAGFSIGQWMVELPIAPQTVRVYAYHKWIGITVLLLTLLRLAWRLAHPVPLPAMPAWQQRAAGASHAILYGLMLAIPLSGWTYSSATGVQVVYLGVYALPDLVPKDKSLAVVLKAVHNTLNLCLLALVLVHAGAALKHHFIDRDGVLLRMLRPGLRRKRETRT